MTDLVEKMAVIDVFDLKIALERATSGLDTELCIALSDLIFKVHLKLTTEEAFKGNELGQLASIESFKYEISRKWFKGKSFEHQLIAILIDATSKDINKSLWIAVVLYLSLVLKIHGKDKESQRLIKRFKTAYFYQTQNYQWIWKKLPILNKTEEITSSFILDTFSLMLDKLNKDKVEVEADKVRGIVETEATTKFRDKKLNQINEVKKYIEVAYYPHRKSKKKPLKSKTKPKKNSTNQNKRSERTKKIKPPKLSDNVTKTPTTSLLNNIDSSSNGRDRAVVDTIYLQDTTAEYPTVEEAVDNMPFKINTYWSKPHFQKRKLRSFGLDAVDFSLKQQYMSLREQELPSDINILTPTSCKLVFNQLISDWKSENKEISLIASTLLLAMITACPVANLIEKGFIENSGLFFAGKRKGYLQSKIGITTIEEYSADNLNSTDLIKIPLPVSLLKLSIEASKSQIKLENIKTYVKRIKESLKIVYLTIAKIESALHFILKRYVEGSNSHIADILCRIDASKAPAIFYSSHSHQELIGHYKKALEFLNIHKLFDLSYIDSSSEDFLTGSGFALKTESVRLFFQRLRYWVIESQSHKQLFNRFSIYTWYCFCILTGTRPNNKLPNIEGLDLEVGWYQVADKPNKVTQNHRLVPLCCSLIKLFKIYRSYLTAIDEPFLETFSTAVHLIKMGQDIPFLNLANTELNDLSPITRGEASKMVQGLTPFHDPYGLRHFVRVNLERQGLSMTLINAVIGHEKNEEQALHSYSSVSKSAIKSVESNFEQIALELGLQDFSDIIYKIIEVNPFVEEYISPENS